MLLTLSLQTMVNFTTSNTFDINKSVSAVHLKVLLTEILHFINNCVTDNNFYSSFVTKDINFIIDIIFPLLLSS